MSTSGQGETFQVFDESFEGVLERARGGSGRALRYLYEQLSPEVAGFLRVRGATDVGVATNEVFHRVFRRLDSFKGGESGFKAWVFTIAGNLLIDEHRKQIRRPNVVASLDPVRHDITGGDVESEAVARLAADDVDQLLQSLTEGQREVLHLRLIAGLTLAETAEVLGRPVGAVKSLQHRAVEALRNKLENSPYPVTR
jgi:RNA polymerase sigma-70 factor (ECF subfamily)